MTNAVLDACTLYPAPLRDLLLRLAQAGLLFPFWSEEIRNEWVRSLLRNRPDLKQEKLERTCREMDAHFPNSLVRGFEFLLPTLTLPDPKDKHILAAAIHAKAEFIVTFNLKDFPDTILQPYGIEAILPDEFVMRLIQRAPILVFQVVRNHRLGLVRPPQTVDEYLATLEKQGLFQTVAFLRKHKDEI